MVGSFSRQAGLEVKSIKSAQGMTSLEALQMKQTPKEGKKESFCLKMNFFNCCHLHLNFITFPQYTPNQRACSSQLHRSYITRCIMGS